MAEQLQASDGLLFGTADLPVSPAGDAAILNVLLPAPADPAQHYREACARVNAHLKSGAAWWTAAEAAAAVARLTGAEKDKSSAWIGFMACGTSLEWVRFRIGDDTWTPSPAGSLSAILHSPINLQGMAALAQSYLRQIQR